MIKKQPLVLGLLLLAGSVSAQKTLVITGKFTGDTKGFNQVYVYGTGVKSDSALMTDGKFTFTLPFDKPFMPLFYTEYDKSVKRMYAPFAVLADQPGTITLSDGDISKGMSSFTVSGLESATLFSEYRKKQNEMYVTVNQAIGEKYGKNWYDAKNNTQHKEANEAQQAAIQAGNLKLVEAFINAHPDSYATGYILSGARTAIDVADLERLYNKLSAKTKASAEAKNVGDYLTGLKKSAIGATVANFTLNTPQDKPFAFSELKGKYVMIDFWASWCGPCKQSFPHMKEVYAKYKSDKFEIYSISIDKDKAAWLKGLEDQQLPWLQSLDTKGISSSGFAVTGVPTTFLIDPKGKILMKEVGFEPGGNSPLEKKLEELFGAK
ncbi:AhpC/TSA family protein [uncultured Chitinophaga sp.]|uniref:AhpC/TSA family protein n=1 Tax=uncultured Chitinophaga sp. TaxID=339340 RepID=UPI0025E3F61D|nr:AhpC/TSA family protein [uncultured Chitinophaga sp.]